MKEFTKTFTEAMEECLNEGVFFQGEDFKDSVYCRLVNGDIKVIEGDKYHRESHTLLMTAGVFKQKYRTFAVANPRTIQKDYSDEVKLEKILDTMEIPELRKSDYGWLARNIGFKNSEHPDYQKAVELIKKLAKK